MEIHHLQAVISRYPWFSYARELLLRKLVSVEPECLESKYKENLVFFPRRDVVLLRCREIARTAERGSEEKAVPVKDLLDVVAPEASASGDNDLFEIDFSQIQKEAESFASNVESADDIVVEMDEEIAEEEILAPFSPISSSELPEKGAVVNSAQKIVVVGGDYFSKEDFAQLDESERVAEIRLGSPADNADRDIEVGSCDYAADFESMDFVTETLAAIYADQGYYEKAIEVYAKLILLYPEKSAYFASLVNEIKSKN